MIHRPRHTVSSSVSYRGWILDCRYSYSLSMRHHDQVPSTPPGNHLLGQVCLSVLDPRKYGVKVRSILSLQNIFDFSLIVAVRMVSYMFSIFAPTTFATHPQCPLALSPSSCRSEILEFILRSVGNDAPPPWQIYALRL